MSTGGLEATGRAPTRSSFAADVMLVADAGNVELGTPTVTTSLRGTGSVLVTVRTMAGPAHSGMYGGAAPDALAALIAVLATLRDDAGETTIDGLDNDRDLGRAPTTRPNGSPPTPRCCDGVGPARRLGLGRRHACGRGRRRRCWRSTRRRSAGVTAAIQHEARAVVNLRVPPGQDAAAAQRLLVEHLEAAAPWGAQVERRAEDARRSRSRRAPTDPAYAALAAAMGAAYGRDAGRRPARVARSRCATRCQAAHPDAEILLIGVEEPACHIHAADESVDPGELARTARASR